MATATVGPSSTAQDDAQVTAQDAAQVTAQVTAQDTAQVTAQDTAQDMAERMSTLINFCSEPRSRKEMMSYMGLTNKSNFRKAYLAPLLTEGKIRMTIPEKPNSKNQNYVKI